MPGYVYLAIAICAEVIATTSMEAVPVVPIAGDLWL